MKIAESYSVIVIPKDRSRLFRWTLSRERILGVLLVALGFLAFSASLFYGFVYYHGEYVATEELRQKGHRYERERKHVLSRLEELEATVSQNEQIVGRLESMVGLGEKQVQVGVGGESLEGVQPSLLQLASLTPSQEKGAELFDETALKSYNLKTLDLTEQAKEYGKRLNKVYHFSPNAMYFWSSVPTILPAKGWETSDFGLRRSPMSGQRQLHQGIDIASPYGSPVLATGDGVVTFAGRHGGLGNRVVIDHGYGIATVYGHNSKILVSVGQKINRGEMVAQVGSSGRSTGPHLHYEILVHGVPVDPHRFLLEEF